MYVPLKSSVLLNARETISGKQSARTWGHACPLLQQYNACAAKRAQEDWYLWETLRFSTTQQTKYARFLFPEKSSHVFNTLSLTKATIPTYC